MRAAKWVSGLALCLSIVGGARGAPGPAPFGTAVAEYDRLTGRVQVSVSSVLNWYIDASMFSPVMAGPDDASDVLPIVPGNLMSDHDYRIGEFSPGFVHFSYTDVDLGQVAVRGLNQGDLLVAWNSDLGVPVRSAEVRVVPEPASLALLGLGGLLVIRRRRAA